MQQKPILGQLPSDPAPADAGPPASVEQDAATAPAETGGREASVSAGLDPTRYGDWEKNGRCIDF